MVLMSQSDVECVECFQLLLIIVTVMIQQNILGQLYGEDAASLGYNYVQFQGSGSV